MLRIPFPLTVPLPILQRTHSLHNHGFDFAPTSDGAYPLTQPDPIQPVGAEAALWANVGVTGAFKQCARVPPGGTFIYTWHTIGWPTTQEEWLYHDHSVCDTENVGPGAIGIVVIHPPAGDPMLEKDVDIRLPDGTLDPSFLPGGSPNGNPIQFRCFPLPREAQTPLLPHQLERVGLRAVVGSMHGMMQAAAEASDMAMENHAGKAGHREEGHGTHGESDQQPPPKLPAEARMLHLGNMAFQLDEQIATITGICFSRFRTPPRQALYLQVYHEFANIGISVNGRKYLGNTPTVLAGPATKMKFGIVGMGSMAHLPHSRPPLGDPRSQCNGHRRAVVWWINGYGGFAIRRYARVRPRQLVFFTIDEGNSFMRALPPLGEWHMHCHVLAHMMDGMMGSLLIVNGGELAPPFAPLSEGQPCPTMPMNPPQPPGPQPSTVNVQVVNFSSTQTQSRSRSATQFTGSGHRMITRRRLTPACGIREFTISRSHSITRLTARVLLDITAPSTARRVRGCTAPST